MQVPVIRQINKKTFFNVHENVKIYKMLLNSVKIYSMRLYHDKYIIKRHFICTSANDDSLSTIKWDNLAWYSSDFNDFRINSTSGCRIVIRSFSTIPPPPSLRRVYAELSCFIRPSSSRYRSLSNFFYIWRFLWSWRILMISKIIDEILIAIGYLLHIIRLFLTLVYQIWEEGKMIKLFQSTNSVKVNIKIPFSGRIKV